MILQNFAKLHANRIHVILDGVFNHVGKAQPLFQCGRTSTAMTERFSQQESRIIRGFTSFPLSRFPALIRGGACPTCRPLIKENPDYQRIIYGKKDSVISKWTSFGVDGWRLDVADRSDGRLVKTSIRLWMIIRSAS